MKLQYDFVTNKVADKTIAVAVGKDMEKFHGFIKLNSTAEFIFNMLKKDVTQDEIVSAILKEYSNVSEQEAKETVEEFINQLKKADVLE